MVFSFFGKKNQAKMVARPAVQPRPQRSESGVSAESEKLSAPPETSIPAVDDSSLLDFSEFVFSESSPDFLIEEDVDPVDGKVEEAAVLFANGQDQVVQEVLEEAVHLFNSARGERLWLMLFDFYRVRGLRPAFEALGIDYAKSFEKSPPVWRDESRGLAKPKQVAAGNLLFRGELMGDNADAFDAVRQAMAKNARLRLDLSKITCLDGDGCANLLALLLQARKSKYPLELLGRDALGALVEQHVEAGRAEAEPCWLLLLELCQLQGRLEAFEDVAINYAITFEVSPPSWESGRVAAPEPLPEPVDPAAAEGNTDRYVLRDEVKSMRFADLPAYAEKHEPVLIDCEALIRIDFISAGALLNVLTTVRRQGKQIVFRHPNHLVAELLGVVGLRAVAAIIFARN